MIIQSADRIKILHTLMVMMMMMMTTTPTLTYFQIF